VADRPFAWGRSETPPVTAQERYRARAERPGTAPRPVRGWYRTRVSGCSSPSARPSSTGAYRMPRERSRCAVPDARFRRLQADPARRRDRHFEDAPPARRCTFEDARIGHRGPGRQVRQERRFEDGPDGSRPSSIGRGTRTSRRERSSVEERRSDGILKGQDRRVSGRANWDIASDSSGLRPERALMCSVAPLPHRSLVSVMAFEGIHFAAPSLIGGSGRRIRRRLGTRCATAPARSSVSAGSAQWTRRRDSLPRVGGCRTRTACSSPCCHLRSMMVGRMLRHGPHRDEETQSRRRQRDRRDVEAGGGGSASICWMDVDVSSVSRDGACPGSAPPRSA
jgi:hypothetical protein